jgi:hypothetical protein
LIAIGGVFEYQLENYQQFLRAFWATRFVPYRRFFNDAAAAWSAREDIKAIDSSRISHISVIEMRLCDVLIFCALFIGEELLKKALSSTSLPTIQSPPLPTNAFTTFQKNFKFFCQRNREGGLAQTRFDTANSSRLFIEASPQCISFSILFLTIDSGDRDKRVQTPSGLD